MRSCPHKRSLATRSSRIDRRRPLRSPIERRRWAFATMLLPGLALGLFSAGCDGTGGIRAAYVKAVPPRDARQAMQRINENLAKIDGALYCKARTSFRFHDANGKDRRFIAHPATVIFESPRCLYFDIKHSLGGSVARIGSNDEQYWLWIDTPETRKLWHGNWDTLEAGSARRVAVPPDQLLDALMLRPLPARKPAASKPLLRIAGNDHRLVFIGLDAEGWPYAQRELVLDHRPPYMPREIIDRLGDGRVVMHAYLKSYKPVKGTGPDGPYTARRYVVYWELDQAEMRLDFSDVRYRTKASPFCNFPDAWEGEIESLDEPPVADLSAVAQEGAVRP